MKFMTKEWYETMQRTDFHLLLKATKNAAVFSEEYFRNLYNDKERAWLRLMKNIFKVSFKDFYPEEFYIDDNLVHSLTPEQLGEEKRSFFEKREQARFDFEKRCIFVPAEEKENFKKALLHRIKRLKKDLPDNILQKIADIRVLALDRACADIKKDITAYCEANKKAVESAMNEYWKEYNRCFDGVLPAFADDFNFHDCKVVSCRKNGKSTILSLDNSGGFTTISKIIFKNCSILKQDAPLHGAWWLY